MKVFSRTSYRYVARKKNHFVAYFFKKNSDYNKSDCFIPIGAVAATAAAKSVALLL
jgi:hypothetical protein